MKILVKNRKAEFDYEILEKFTAGIKLLGYEVKSVKSGMASLKGSFVSFYDDEAYLLGVNISPWQPKNTPKEYDPQRSRKLLLNKKELNYLIGKNKQGGLTIIPISIFLKNNIIKVELGLVKGKKKYDKREDIKQKDVKREIDKKLKEY